MVRTVGTAIKTTGGKSSKAVAISRGNTSIGSSSRKTIGGNKLVTRPIPDWQKSILNFCDRKSEKEIPINPEGLVIVDTEEESIPLEAPDWQKPVTNFLIIEKPSSSSRDIEESGSSQIMANKENLTTNRELVQGKKKKRSECEESTTNPSKKQRMGFNYAKLEIYEQITDS